MKIHTITNLAALLCLSASFSIAGTVSVIGSASYLGGLNGSWSFQYTTDAPGLSLQSIVLDLSPTDLRFDTAAGGFGSLSYKDVGGFGGTDAATGLSGISATGAALDGGTILTFSFTNFTSGSIFQFSSDVDHPDPADMFLAFGKWPVGHEDLAAIADSHHGGRIRRVQPAGEHPRAFRAELGVEHLNVPVDLLSRVGRGLGAALDRVHGEHVLLHQAAW